MSRNRLTETDRIQQARIRVIYSNYLLSKSDPSFRREAGSGSSGQGSQVLDLLTGAVYGPCSVPTVSASIAPTPTLVTADLLIHFEANDPTSYSGSGMTWVNIGTGGSDYNAILAGDSESGIYPVFVNDTIKSFQFALSFLGDGYSYLYNNYMYFQRPDAISDDFTWCAWIKTTDVGHDSNHYNLMFIVSTETGGLNNDFGFGLDSEGYLAYGDGSATGSDITIRSTQAVNTGTWTFVAVTREKATGHVVLYINGVADTTGTCNIGNTLSTAENVLIGSETDFPGYTFGGYIGAVLGNTSVLTAEQIMQNFNAQRAVYGI